MIGIGQDRPDHDLAQDRIRRHGQRRTTVMVSVAPSFVDDLLWSEFNQFAEALREYLDAAMERIIREEVLKDSTEPETA
jgi:tRNA nucleotidyltransferase (CCA-adding enzyme)